MSKIRKFTMFFNRELLDKGKYNGIHINTRFERTACRCGHVTQGKVYECPVCGNKDFEFDLQNGSSISESDYQVEIKGNDFCIFKSSVKVHLNSEIELVEERYNYFVYIGGKLEFRAWGIDDVYLLLLKHFEELPTKLKEVVSLMKKYKLDKLDKLQALFYAGSNFNELVKNEEGQDILFVKEVINKFLARNYSISGYDISFTTFDGCCRTYKIPDEFKTMLRINPAAVLGQITSYGTRGFQCPQNWNMVTQEIKNIAWYYYENGVISFYDYLNLGNINKSVIGNTDLISLFLKKYMMQFESSIVNKMNEVCKYLIDNSIAIDKTTFDYKYYIQNKNIAFIKEEVARSEYDIDNFINSLGVGGLEAFHTLAKCKKTRKGSTT